MTILKILKAPHPILKTKAENIPMVDDSIRTIMDNMLETMYHDDGVGLAANQVGILKRILVLDLRKDSDLEKSDGFYPIFMANPEIISSSDETICAEERCLSLPEQKIEVNRFASIKVKYLDYNNKIQELDADGWLARAIQHEMDHLDGVLLIDYLSVVKKDVAIRKLRKLKNIN